MMLNKLNVSVEAKKTVKFVLSVISVMLAVQLFTAVPDAAAQAPVIDFGSSGLQGGNVNNPTSLQFGPDNRLYVSNQFGLVFAYNIDRNGPDDYIVTETETINLIQQIPNHNDDGTLCNSSECDNKRQITGIFVTGTGNNPIVFVSSSDPRIGAGGGGSDLGLDTNSGVISRLECVGGMDGNNECTNWEKIDIVRGLPRSEENHAVNGIQLNETTNELLVAVGGSTNAGAPSNNFAFTTEYVYSAAIIAVDLTAVMALPTKTDGNNVDYKYNLPTLNDPTGVADPWGGDDGLNQAMWDSNGIVTLFATGFRNPYDLVITESGKIYTIDNGANGGWGGYPEYEESADCTNNYISGEPGSQVDGPDPNSYPAGVTLLPGSDGQPDAKVNNLNGLHLVTEGYYGGHPTPIRGNPAGAGLFYKDDDTDALVFLPDDGPLPANWPPVPVEEANPIECDFQNSGVDDGTIANFGPSTNGMTEYTASNFDGALQGDLLAAGFASTGPIFQIKLDASGTVATNCPALPAKCDGETFASGFGAQPLDVVAQGDADVFPGTVWAVTYGADSITVFEPADYDGGVVGVCTGADDNGIDEDDDGYTNADEIDNGTNPCSGASIPTDFDKTLIPPPPASGGFLVSDLNDPDDDDDGLLDNEDPFVWDANNGNGTDLPIDYPLFNGIPGEGFFGLGYTGLMVNGDDYLALIDDNDSDDIRQIVAGGTAGIYTDTEVGEGDAFEGNNDLKNGFQFGINVDDMSAPFTIQARVLGNFLGGTAGDFKSHGIYIGTGDQDNYIKLAVNSTGIELVTEQAGTAATTAQATLTGHLTEVYVDLLLNVNPTTDTVQAYYALDSDPSNIIALGGPIALTGDLAAVVNGTYQINGIDSALAVGFIATSRGPADPFSATWDFIEIVTEEPPELTVSPVELDFGTVVDGSTSAPQAVEVTHTGGLLSGPLQITDVQFAGANAAEFADNATLPITLSPGETEFINVTFSPADVANDKEATLNIIHDGNNASPQTVALTGAGVASAAPIICVNSNGTAFTTVGGVNFAADQYFVGGTPFTSPNPTLEIANTDDDLLYRTNRFGGHTYNLPVPDAGSYVVELYFAEIFHDAAGDRVFDVEIEEQLVLDDYDIFAAAGGANTAVSEVFSVNTDDTTVKVEMLVGTVDLPKLSGVCVSSFDDSGNLAPVVADIDNQLNSEGDDIGAAGLFVQAADNDGPANLDYSAINLPPGVELEPTNGQLFGTVEAGAVAGSPYAVEITVDDGLDITTIDFLWFIADELLAPACAGAGDVIYRINNGGPALPGVPAWSADQAVLASQAYKTAAAGTPSSYVNFGAGDFTYGPENFLLFNQTGVPNSVFSHERFSGRGVPDNMQWDFPVNSDDYVVNLYFSENYEPAGTPGGRLFDVNIEGALVLDNYDTYVTAGNSMYTAVKETIQTTVIDGQLDIDFIKVVQNPSVKGIEVICTAENGIPVPTVNVVSPEDGSTIIGDTIDLSWTSLNGDAGAGDQIIITLDGEAPIGGQPLNGTYQFTGVADGPRLITVEMADVGGTVYGNPEATDLVNITMDSGLPEPSALIQVSSGADIFASTFTPDSFVIENTGNVDITSVVIDLSTAFMPDLVFDPLGTAGDADTKCIDPDSVTGTPGYVAPGDPCADPFSLPNNGTDGQDGYAAATLNFTDFNEGEVFTFSADIDPTSTKGATAVQTDAVSVSGFELIGATVTVTFDGGTVLTANLFDEGSEGGAQAVVAEGMPFAPTLAVAGIATPPVTVTTPNQTLEISGTPYANLQLLQVDSRFYVDGVGYDPDPFEANSAVARNPVDVVLDAAGNASVPVTLLQTNKTDGGPDGGFNHFVAVSESVGDLVSQTSNVIVLEYDPDAVANDVPVVTILTPADGSSFTDVDVIALSATAADTEDGDVSASITWQSDIDGVLGAGAAITATLSPGVHTITAQAVDGNSFVGAATIAVQISSSVAAPGPLLYRVNAGGVTLDATDGSKPVWSLDRPGTPSQYVTLGTCGNCNTLFGRSNVIDMSHPSLDGLVAPEALFQTERYQAPGADPMSWDFPVVSGSTVLVRVYLSELSKTGAGQRVFDIEVEGVIPAEFDDIDVFDLAGGANVGLVLEYELTMADDNLDLDFIQIAAEPMVKGLEVIEITSNGGNLAPVISNPGNQTKLEDKVVSLQIEATAPEIGQTLTYSATNLPLGLSIDPDTGLISGITSVGTTDNVCTESGGFVVVEIETVAPTDDWSLQTGVAGFSGTGYYEWDTGNTDTAFDPAGTGILRYPIEITTAGTYRFQLHSSSPAPGGDYNDSWFRVQGTGSSAKGIQGPLANPTSEVTMGNSWFKGYQNVVNNWTWNIFHVDFAGHKIYMEFEQPGLYFVEISGRSHQHKLDRFVLYDEAVDNYTNAELDGLLPSACDTAGVVGAADNSPYNVVITVTDDGTPNEAATVEFTWTVPD